MSVWSKTKEKGWTMFSNETQIKRSQTSDPQWLNFKTGLACGIGFWFFLSLSQIIPSAVPKFISSVLYEGPRTVGLQMGQFNFPRLLITLVKQGKRTECQRQQGKWTAERGGGGTDYQWALRYEIIQIDRDDEVVRMLWKREGLILVLATPLWF